MTEQIVTNALNLVDAADKEAFWANVEKVYQSGEHESAYTLIRNDLAMATLVNVVVENEEDDDALFAVSEFILHFVENKRKLLEQDTMRERFSLLLYALLLDSRLEYGILPIINSCKFSEMINHLLIDQKDVWKKLDNMVKNNKEKYQHFLQLNATHIRGGVEIGRQQIQDFLDLIQDENLLKSLPSKAEFIHLVDVANSHEKQRYAIYRIIPTLAELVKTENELHERYDRLVYLLESFLFQIRDEWNRCRMLVQMEEYPVFHHVFAESLQIRTYLTALQSMSPSWLEEFKDTRYNPSRYPVYTT